MNFQDYLKNAKHGIFNVEKDCIDIVVDINKYVIQVFFYESDKNLLPEKVEKYCLENASCVESKFEELVAKYK